MVTHRANQMGNLLQPARPPLLRKTDATEVATKDTAKVVGGARWQAVLILSLSLLAAVVLFQFDPTRSHFYPVCYFHQTTGLLCPGCGSLRALHQLLHGHLATAFHYNALLVCALPLLGWFGLRFVIRRISGERAPFGFRPVWVWSGLVAALAFGILRNLPYPQFAWMAP